MRKISLTIIALALVSCTGNRAPVPFGACPTPAQVEWQKCELKMFYHFGAATFNGLTGERATNTYDAAQLMELYRPDTINAGQWARVARESGFKGVVLTTKHHDGFSLWPNPHSICNVSLCPEPYNTDVVEALSKACAAEGIEFGVYLSPWDKNDETFGTLAYNDHYVASLSSLLDGRYGHVTEVWLDGNGATKSPYDFKMFTDAIYANVPDAVIFSDVGPGCRWVGNESGYAAETNWSTYSPEDHGARLGYAPGGMGGYLPHGDVGGKYWIPAETDVSIRPTRDSNGWFWGPDEEPVSASELMKMYYESVGRNSLLLLNVPPTTAGVIDDKDIAVLMEFKAMRDEVFSVNLAEGARAESSSCRGRVFRASNMLDADYDSYYSAPDGVESVDIVFDLHGEKNFNRLVLQEYIPLGQRVSKFSIHVKQNGQWTEWGEGEKTTIGYKRIILGPDTKTDSVRICIESALACPVLNGFGLYYDRF